MKRHARNSLGVVALVLGGIGIVLPLLPTTPFIILAAFAFSKSSPRLHAYLLNHRVFGPMIVDWRENGGIAPRYKVVATLMMASVLAFSYFTGGSQTVLIIQGIVMIGAASYVLS